MTKDQKQKEEIVANLLKKKIKEANKKRRTTIKICSREWDLVEDKKTDGARFHTHNDTGKGSIQLGSDFSNKTYRFGVLLHEVIEGILTTDLKRYEYRLTTDNYLFIFDHNYLMSFTDKIIDALISCNAIKINSFDTIFKKRGK